MAEGPDLKEFVEGFLVEAQEHLTASEKNLLALEEASRRGEPSPRAVRELFRSLHTLKGLAGMVGVEPIVAVAHEMEAILRTADRSAGRLTPDVVDLLHQGLRAIRERVAQLASKGPVAPAPARLLEALAEVQGRELVAEQGAVEVALEQDLLDKLSPAERLQLTQGVAKGLRALRMEFIPSPARSERGLHITSLREQLGRVAEIVKVVPRALPASERAPGGLSFVLLLLSAVPDAALIAASGLEPEALEEIRITVPPPASVAPDLEEEEPQVSAGGRSVIRVEVGRLDDAMEKLSGMVVTRFRLARAAAGLGGRGADVRELQEILSEHSRQLRDLRAAILRARMVPVSELLERVPLLLRGLSRARGQPVRLTVDAGKAELDKAVGERIFPAIVHLVRNAVDHGLSPLEARRARGKDEGGEVRVQAFARGNGLLELSVSDDGEGIDAAKVAQRAGVPLPRTDAELLALITRPGLSTRDTVTQVSGRGMGMEIVRRAVEGLGGQLLLQNRPGQGTTFTLQIPLTLTVVDAFSFEVRAQSFVAPVNAVEEILEITSERVIRPPGRGEATWLFELRGEPLPLFSLSRALALDGPSELPAKALVVRRNGAPAAFGVDRVLGQQEVVVRPMEDPLVKVREIAGTTDLGDGRPTLVLDLMALAARLGTSRQGAEP